MRYRVAAVVLLLILVGCDFSTGTGSRGGTPGGTAGGTPGGASGVTTPLMQPYQGPWKFDLQKTLALWRVKGIPAAEIAEAKKLSAVVPVHPDMTITGNGALFTGSPLGSYDFFALHQHNQWVCGKAWHHEDRNDPGDMDKYYTRLELTEDGRELRLSTRVEEDAANPTDPDVTNMPPTAGSATTCGADAAPAAQWSSWRTYVFVRG
jgi:hypothetical protein